MGSGTFSQVGIEVGSKPWPLQLAQGSLREVTGSCPEPRHTSQVAGLNVSAGPPGRHTPVHTARAPLQARQPEPGGSSCEEFRLEVVLHGGEAVLDPVSVEGIRHEVLDRHEGVLGGDAGDFRKEQEGRGEGQDLLLLVLVELDPVEQEHAQAGHCGAIRVVQAVAVKGLLRQVCPPDD